MSSSYILHESSIGYAIFKVVQSPDTIGASLKEVQAKMDDLALFGKMVQVTGFAPFEGAQQALENINDISEGILPPYLHDTLSANLPASSKKHPVTLGVADKELASAIKDAFPHLECQTPATHKPVGDLLRGLRLHSAQLLRQLRAGDTERAQLGLGHSYSRAKVKFNVNRNDNHVIQAIALLDHLDKAINQFSMRVREWYSWHFPELVRLVSDNHTYAQLALHIGDKKTLTPDALPALLPLVAADAPTATAILDAARLSMGQDFSAVDLAHVRAFARRVVRLTAYRARLTTYLGAKLTHVAPNLAALIGDTVAARLIARAGSLTNLAKYPASTLQILGAEKALFRALKTKTHTPKYGLIYHSSFIGRAGQRNKGRISRFLANKCSIASRIDGFSEAPSTRYGEALRGQVEERLAFYAEGTKPRRNADVMRIVGEADDVLGGLKAVDGVDVVDGVEGELNGEGDTQPGAREAIAAAPGATAISGAAKGAAEALRDAERKAAKKEKKRKREQEADGGEKKKKKKKREKHRHGKE